MIALPIADRRTRQREATRTEILDAALELSRTQGLAGISMRDLAARVGMRQPSLYTYFASKSAIYDALFARSWRELGERLVEPDRGLDARAALRAGARAFVDFCVEEPPRFQLMCQRPVPGFEPSAEAYAPALEVHAAMQAELARRGITDPAAADIWTALITGLVNQQLANDPGGDRWTRLIDEVVEMFVRHEAHNTEENRQ